MHSAMVGGRADSAPNSEPQTMYPTPSYARGQSAMVGGRADSADKNMEDIARNDVQKGKKVADMMHGKPP